MGDNSWCQWSQSRAAAGVMGGWMVVALARVGFRLSGGAGMVLRHMLVLLGYAG